MSFAIPREQIEALKAQAMMAEKGASRFSVRLSVTGGYLTAAQLQTVAAFVEQFW